MAVKSSSESFVFFIFSNYVDFSTSLSNIYILYIYYYFFLLKSKRKIDIIDMELIINKLSDIKSTQECRKSTQEEKIDMGI